LIRYGEVETLEDLDYILFQTVYPRLEGGDPIGISLACIDSGYRTDEVYHFCRSRPESLRPVKGYQHLAGAPQQTTRLDHDASGKPIPEGLTLWRLDTSYLKDKLSRLIHAHPGDPGEWHLGEGVGQEYYDHLTAEQKITQHNRKSGKIWEEWMPVSEGRANHLLDAEIYAIAAADMLRVYMMEDEEDRVMVYQPRRLQGSSWLGAPTRPNPARARGWLRP
jgi:phage terminase large subunit GpA-like protein